MSIPNQDNKQFNFYANSTILLLGFMIILYLLKRSNRNLKDFNSYDWSKFPILSDSKFKSKKHDNKDKSKTRVKEYSKGTGFIKEENKFPVLNFDDKEKEGMNFLNFEESNNLQDMINYAASIKNDSAPQTNIYPIESLYTQVMKNPQKGYNNIYTNEKLDRNIADILRDESIREDLKIEQILEFYSQLLKMKNKNLSEETYVGLVEIFMRNGYLNHASYFLCQMDRLQINIPRKLLDLFLDYSITNQIFEKRKEEIVFETKADKKKEPKSNKFDDYSPNNDPDYAYYFSKRNHFMERKDINDVFKKLKLDSKPYFPKKTEESSTPKTKLADIDPSKVKEYIPKNYRVVKKEEN